MTETFRQSLLELSTDKEKQEGGLFQAILKKDRTAAAKGISLIERGSPEGDALLQRLYPFTGKAHVIGVTGGMGVGKSSLISALVKKAREAGLTVGVILVDPVSSLTGGSLLGDRVRFSAHTVDPDVFLRSFSVGRGDKGSSMAVWGARRVFEAMGKEMVFVEASGCGRFDAEVSRMADSIVAVTASGVGDDVQVMKAGTFETADILIVNRADKSGLEKGIAHLRGMMSYRETPEEDFGWKVPVISILSVSHHEVEPVWSALAEHREFLSRSQEGLSRRKRQAEAELHQHVGCRLHVDSPALAWQPYLKDLVSRRLDPSQAAEKIVQVLRKKKKQFSN